MANRTPMRALLPRTLLAVLLVIPLTGCWDSRNLENVAYVTGLGFDREQEQFAVYAQIVAFSAVAKTDMPNAAGTAPVWVGKGVGRTVYEALGRLAVSVQHELNIEQLKSVVVREPAMPYMDDILDAVNRVRVARYTSWVFGTKGELNKLFNADTFFGSSQLSNLLYDPTVAERQNSYVQPLSMQKFVAAYNERSVTALLPDIELNARKWKLKKQSMQVQQIAGFFAFEEKKVPGYYPREKTEGIVWVNSRFHRRLVTLQKDKRNDATVAVKSAAHKVSVSSRNGRPFFTLRIKLIGELNELFGRMTHDEIETMLKQQVKREVADVYMAGVKQGEDVLGLEETLFRYHFQTWKKLRAAGGWKPAVGDLDVQVSFTLRHAGAFELK